MGAAQPGDTRSHETQQTNPFPASELPEIEQRLWISWVSWVSFHSQESNTSTNFNKQSRRSKSEPSNLDLRAEWIHKYQTSRSWSPNNNRELKMIHKFLISRNETVIKTIRFGFSTVEESEDSASECSQISGNETNWAKESKTQRDQQIPDFQKWNKET